MLHTCGPSNQNWKFLYILPLRRHLMKWASVFFRNGVETVPLEFGNAEKRAVWETAFREAKTALSKFYSSQKRIWKNSTQSIVLFVPVNQQISAPPAQLKSVIAHQTRPGLQVDRSPLRFSIFSLLWSPLRFPISVVYLFCSIPNSYSNLDYCTFLMFLLIYNLLFSFALLL